MKTSNWLWKEDTPPDKQIRMILHKSLTQNFNGNRICYVQETYSKNAHHSDFRRCVLFSKPIRCLLIFSVQISEMNLHVLSSHRMAFTRFALQNQSNEFSLLKCSFSDDSSKFPQTNPVLARIYYVDIGFIALAFSVQLIISNHTVICGIVVTSIVVRFWTRVRIVVRILTQNFWEISFLSIFWKTLDISWSTHPILFVMVLNWK